MSYMKITNIICLVVLCFANLCHAHEAQGQDTRKHVLVLSSFSRDTFWGRTQLEGIESVIPNDTYHLIIEETEMWENMDKPKEEDLDNVLRHFKKEKFDIIVVLDPPAINMVEANFHRFPQDAKYLLAGTMGDEPESLKSKPNVMVMSFPLAVEANISIGMKLFPDTKRIVSITDGCEDGIIEENYVKWIVGHMKNRDYDALPQYNTGVAHANVEDVEFYYINGIEYSTQELIAKLTELAKEPLFVIHYGWGSPKDSETLEQPVYSEMISKAVDKRMLAFFDDSADFVVGGYMTNGVHLGAFIGEKAKELIEHDITIDLYEALNVISLRINWEVFSEKNMNIAIMPPFTAYYGLSPKLWDFLDYRWVTGVLCSVSLIFVMLSAFLFRSRVVSRRTAERFHELALQMETTLGSIADAVVVADKYGNVTFINAAACEFLGYADRKVVLKSHIDDVYKLRTNDTDTPMPSPTKRVAQSNGKVSSESGYIVAPKGKCNVADSISTIRINEAFAGYILTFKDVTSEYRQRAQALGYATRQKVVNECLNFAIKSNDSMETMHKIMELLCKNLGADMMFMHRVDEGRNWAGSIKYRDEEKLKGKKFTIYAPPPIEFVVMLEKLESNQAVKFSTRPGEEHPDFPGLVDFQKKNDVKSSMLLGFFDEGKICGFFGIIYITNHHVFTRSDEEIMRSVARIIEMDFEKNKHMEKVKAAENERRLILDSIHVPIMLFDKDGKLVTLNNAAAKARPNCTREELLSKPCDVSFCEGKYADPSLCPVKRAIKEKKTVSLQKNAYGRNLISTATPIFDDEGNITNIIESDSDVTELVDLNKKLVDAMRSAQESERAKSLFLATMSHELRTPLNAVIGYSELTQSPELNQVERMHNLKNINFAANTLLGLINDILDLSKLEAGQLEIHKIPLSMVLLSEEFSNIFKFSAKRKGIDLNMNVQDGIPTLMMDMLRLKQILMNVIGNAIKFTQKGGIDVTISFEKQDEKTGELRIKVKDTGVGIDPENLAKIFKPFEQENSQRIRTRSRYEGTGLGLMIVKRLLEKMDGKVEVQSTPNVGSTFDFRFARVEISTLAAENGEHQKPKAVSVRKMEDFTADATVLVVDDVMLNIKVLRNMLIKMGVNVLESLSGEDALEMMKTTKPDLVMTDLWMPNMNGEEFAKAMKGDPALARIPVVAVTADTQLTDDENLFEDVLYKPITMRGVFEILEEHVPTKLRKKESVAG